MKKSSPGRSIDISASATPRARGRTPGSMPLSRKVADDLRRRLHGREWPRGTQLPSIRQLAISYGVGARVIRSALEILKAEDRIELTARRQAIAKEQGYICTAIYAAVALVLTNRLDVQAQSPIFAAIFRGIQDGIGKRCDPLLVVHDAKRTQSRVPPDLMDLPLSGILLCGTFQGSTLRAYARLGVPVVLVDQPGETWKISSVSVDNVNAAMDATKRLIQLGHRRIAFLRFVHLGLSAIDPDSRERELGFHLALKESGISTARHDVYNFFSKDTPNSSSMRAILTASPRYTAALCADTFGAQVLAEAARLRGIGIPHSFSIACFHSAPGKWAEWSGPRTDFEALGRRAVAILTKRSKPIHERISSPWHEGVTVAAQAPIRHV